MNYSKQRTFFPRSALIVRAIVCWTGISCAALLTGALPAHALAPLPDVGVDYRDMRVADPAILKGYGMKEVRKGDAVKLDLSRRNEIILHNLQSGEVVVIPRF